jgi:hypothetical protein
MTLSSSDLVDVHGVVGPSEELVDRRRATYQAAVELAGGLDQADSLDMSVLDNPMVRGHLADVLAGSVDLDPDLLVGIDTLAVEVGRWRIADKAVRMVSSTNASAALAPALARVSAELVRSGAGGLTEVVLSDGSAAFGTAVATIRRGIELACYAAPELVLDLLPHVALLAVLDREAAGSLGSASAREFPGLIVLPAPSVPLEAAEALVHEGAHQKLFDMAIVGSVFASGYHNAPPFTPPWARESAPAWPFEQTFAAYHAYCCLAAFWKAVRRVDLETHAFSLLPYAADRADVLGEWVEQRSEFLGRDGRRLLDSLCGHPPRTAVNPVDGWAERPSATVASRLVTRQVGPWQLIMRWARPVEIRWRKLEADPGHRSHGG